MPSHFYVCSGVGAETDAHCEGCFQRPQEVPCNMNNAASLQLELLLPDSESI